MGFLDPTPPPYDPLKWVRLPLEERARRVCESWALQGYGAPLAVYFVYVLKLALYMGGWLGFCSLSPALGGPAEIGDWWLEPLAFQKAILWSLLFEVLGLGCGSGPLTARYVPPFGGVLYWLRPGTTKLALFPGLPVLGGGRRTWVDIGLYAGLLGAAVWALIAPEIEMEHLVLIAVLVPLLGVADKTIFLAARGEHYWVMVVVFLFVDEWIAGAMAVQLALWFWAGFSKLNHHFPAVVCVMTSNSPFTRFEWLRKRMYRKFPDDLRPSGLATVVAHVGTALELGVPLVFLFWSGETGLFVGLVLMLMLHAYISSNVPMGVPIEWNFMVVYGGFALFWAHPEVGLMDLASPELILFLLVMLVALPLLGNFSPKRLSFLLSMRYYAGNWPYSIWLFRGESQSKLKRLKTTSPLVHEQLGYFYDEATVVGLVGKVMGFRMMHLQGRALSTLIPKAIDGPLRDYEYLDGELVAGIVLGWNFGDGHLHNERLLSLVQERCEFEAGELRCIFIESQALFGSGQAWRIVDAASGLREQGEISVAELRSRQPHTAGPGA